MLWKAQHPDVEVYYARCTTGGAMATLPHAQGEGRERPGSPTPRTGRRARGVREGTCLGCTRPGAGNRRSTPSIPSEPVHGQARKASTGSPHDRQVRGSEERRRRRGHAQRRAREALRGARALESGPLPTAPTSQPAARRRVDQQGMAISQEAIKILEDAAARSAPWQPRPPRPSAPRRSSDAGACPASG